MTKITRRGFFAGAGAVIGFASLGGVLDLLDNDRVFLRPPGAGSETEFISRCERCQKCVSVCPARVIQPVSITDSIRSARTPFVDFSQDYCDFCVDSNAGIPRCAEVCPTGALNVPPGKPTIDGKAVVNKKSCVAWDWVGCTACVTECPQEAISLDEGNRPVVDDTACDGCGLCELICPSDSLRAYSGASTQKGITVVASGGGMA